MTRLTGVNRTMWRTSCCVGASKGKQRRWEMDNGKVEETKKTAKSPKELFYKTRERLFMTTRHVSEKVKECTILF